MAKYVAAKKSSRMRDQIKPMKKASRMRDQIKPMKKSSRGVIKAGSKGGGFKKSSRALPNKPK